MKTAAKHGIHLGLSMILTCWLSASATAEPFTPQASVGVVPYFSMGDGTDHSVRGDVIEPATMRSRRHIGRQEVFVRGRFLPRQPRQGHLEQEPRSSL